MERNLASNNYCIICCWIQQLNLSPVLSTCRWQNLWSMYSCHSKSYKIGSKPIRVREFWWPSLSIENPCKTDLTAFKTLGGGKWSWENMLFFLQYTLHLYLGQRLHVEGSCLREYLTNLLTSRLRQRDMSNIKLNIGHSRQTHSPNTCTLAILPQFKGWYQQR